MSREDRVKLISFTKAQARKEQLEAVFIDTFLLISAYFKE